MGVVGRESTDAALPDVGVVTPTPDPTRFDGAMGEGLRGKAARGTVINSAFLIGLNLLNLFRGFAVAPLISVSDYGVWGLLIVSFITLYGLVQIGVGDKYVQQDSADQEQAFQSAFTLQLILSCVFVVLIVALMPVFALVYGTWEILLPGWALAVAMPATAFQTPLWTFYRRMDFLKQRRLQVLDPIVSIIATLALALAGMGYWSLVIGTILGAWSAALVAVRASPYKLALRYERGTAKEYASYSGPLFFQGFCLAVIRLAPVLVAQRALGVAAVGAMAIANNISVYATKVEQVVTSTIYPVVCAVKDRKELLQEAFLKSNRMGLLWAAPTGIGIALFAPDLVNFVLGSRWSSAIPVIQAFGLVALVNQVGFNWSAFFRATGDTRPIGVAAGIMTLAVTGIAVPLLWVGDLAGYALGMGLAATVMVGVRLIYLRRLFSLAPIAVNIARGVFPALVALAGAGGIRLLLWGGERSEQHALLELVAFAALTAAVTLLSERVLLGEFRGYLRRRPAVEQPA